MAFQAGAVVSKLTLDRSKFSASIKTVQKQTRTLGGWVKKNSAQFRGMGIAITAMGAAALLTFKKMVKQYVEVGDMVHKMALRTGFAAETLSELAFAADISGADLTMLEKGVKKMSKTIVDASYGLETYLRVFRSLGIEIEDIIDLSPEEQFLKLGAAIAGMESQTLKTAAAVDIFGRAGTMLLPLFAEGAEGIAKLREEAHLLGIIFDEEAAAKAAKLKDAQTALKGSVQGLSIAILNDLIPILTDVTKGFTDFFVTSREDAGNWTDAILGFFKIVAKGVEAIGLAWHGMQVIVFKGAEFIVKAIKFQIDALTTPLRLLAKLPGYGILAEKMLKEVTEHTASLTAISEGYNEEAAEQIENLTDIVFGFNKFITMLEKVSDGLKTSKEEMESFGEAAVAVADDTPKKFDLWAHTIGKIFHDTSVRAAEMRGAIETKIKLPPIAINIPKMSLEDFKEFYEKWLEDLKDKWERQWQEMLGWAQYFVSQLSGIFSQLTENQIMNIENEYEVRRAAIENSLMTEQSRADAIERLDAEFEKRRKKAMRAQAIRTKAIGIMEAIIHTASAITEALPNIPLSIAVGILGAIQVALIAAQPLPALAKGGRLGRGEAGIVGERGAELFVPDISGTIIPIREGAGALRPVYVTIAPTYQISTIDEMGVRDFMRDRGLPAIVEAIKVGIQKPELQDALRIK